MTAENLATARESILAAFGVLPALFDPGTAGALVREAQGHLAQWPLQPIASECAAILAPTSIDVMQSLQAYDAGGRAHAFSGVIEDLAAAKTAGLSEQETLLALQFSGINEQNPG